MQRVRKEQKGKKGKGNILVSVVVLFVAVACGMYFWDNGFSELPFKTTTSIENSIITDVSNNNVVSEVAKAEAMLHGIQTIKPTELTQGVDPQEQIDAILKAFSHLPPSELERLQVNINQPVQAGTPEADVLLNTWKVRQIELKEAMKSVLQPAEHMANLTRVLNGTSEVEGRPAQPLRPDEQVYLLRQLESLLDDVDNARDFHTIGAWPTLLSFLTAQRTDEVRAAAAWAVGTAVKNTYDYQLWTLESAGEQSGLELLVALLEPTATTSSNADDDSVAMSDLYKRALYALSAAMRGNIDVQEALRVDKHTVPYLTHLLRLASTPELAADLQRKVWASAADLLEERAFIRRELSDEIQKQLQAQHIDNKMNTSSTDASSSNSMEGSNTVAAPVEVAARSVQHMPLLGDLLITELWIQTAVRSGRKLTQKLLESDSKSVDFVSQHAALRSVMAFIKEALQDSPQLYNLPTGVVLQDSWQGKLQQLVRIVSEDLDRTSGSYDALIALSDEVSALIGLLDQGANAAVF